MFPFCLNLKCAAPSSSVPGIVFQLLFTNFFQQMLDVLRSIPVALLSYSATEHTGGGSWYHSNILYIYLFIYFYFIFFLNYSKAHKQYGEVKTHKLKYLVLETSCTKRMLKSTRAVQKNIINILSQTWWESTQNYTNKTFVTKSASHWLFLICHIWF